MSQLSEWIKRFCAEKENQFFCEIDLNYIQEKYVQTGIKEQVTNFRYALKRLFDIETAETQKWSYRRRETLKEDTKTLYGLVHARYILSSRGQYKMLEKYKSAQFGKCPRTLCKGSAVLPIGLSDQKGVDSVKVYCPKCTQIYNPTNKTCKNIDGAYFGTVFPYLFFMVLPEHKPKSCLQVETPQMFGFKFNEKWHENSMEMKQDQITQFLKFQEIEQKNKQIMQQERYRNTTLDVQQELDKNSKEIWDQMRSELKETVKNTPDKPPAVSDNVREAMKALLGNNDSADEKTSDDEKKKTKTSVFKAFVGLDLGTNITKIGYCLPTDDTIHILMETNTAILLEENGTFKGFGEDAISSYTNTIDLKLLYFEHYMMNMYNKDEVKNVTAFNGTQYKLSSLVIETLKYLKQSTIDLLQKQNVNVRKTKDISWVLCVPSRDANIETISQRMFQYATAAGLVDKSMFGHVTFKPSTHCAAMNINDSILDFVWGHDIKYIKYVIVDAGGCNVEFSCDELSNGKIKNILDVAGEEWGDQLLDNIFIGILCAMFGREHVDRFATQKPNIYLALLCNFRKAKLSFYFHDDWCAVELPLEFVDYIKGNVKDIVQKVEAFEYNEWTKAFVLKENKLEIHHNIWVHELFDKIVNKIMEHLYSLLSNEKMKLCQYIYLIGGFGDNHYLQKRLKEEYNDFTEYKIDTVIPKQSILNVVRGAVKIARDQGFEYKVTEVDDTAVDDWCYHCDRIFDAKRLRCGGCKRVAYCSANCQKLNWKLHQNECKKWRKENDSNISVIHPMSQSV